MNKPLIETIIGQDVALRGNKNELHSWCPFCSTDKKQKSDRFVVWKDNQRFWCRQCGASGDVIEYIKLRDGIDFKNACQVLGIALDGQSSTRPRKITPKKEQSESKRLSEKRQIGFNSESWQKSALRYCEQAYDSLHFMRSGAQGRAYLNSRGITNRNIWNTMMLGYSKKWRGQFGDENVYLPRGIVFPYVVSFERIVSVDVRDMDNGKRKYVKATQSANTLYNGSRLRNDTPAVIVESEIDVLSIMQAINNPRLIVPVATGSTSASRIIDAVARLSTCPRVYIAFDSDDAGEKASAWWLDILRHNAVRLRPTQKDVNEMLLAGDDICAWLGVQ